MINDWYLLWWSFLVILRTCMVHIKFRAPQLKKKWKSGLCEYKSKTQASNGQYINDWEFFFNFSRSTRNQALKTDLIAILIPPRRINGSDNSFGAHKSQRRGSNGVGFFFFFFFANIWKFKNIQRLKFRYMAVFDLLNLFNGLELDLGAQKYQKKKKRKGKTGLPWLRSPLLFIHLSLQPLFEIWTFCGPYEIDTKCLNSIPNGHGKCNWQTG